MKADNLKQTKKSKGVARIKMLMQAHLYWLNGYPECINGEIIWNCPLLAGERQKSIALSATMISKAYRVINELRRDFPIALPIVVGNVSEWAVRSKSYLDYCKIFLASKENTISFSLFNKEEKYAAKYLQNLTTTQSQCELVKALSWMHYINRQQLDKSLEYVTKYWLEIQKDGAYGIFLHSQICRLYFLDVSKVQGLFRLLFNESYLHVATSGGKKFINPFIQFRFKKKQHKAFAFPEKPVEKNSLFILALVPWLLTLNNIQRRRALSLINCVQIETMLQRWFQWWQDVELLTNKISKLIQYADINKNKQLSCLQSELKLCLQRYPDTFEVLDVSIAIKKFSTDEALTKSLVQVINRLPVELSSLQFCIHFYQCYEENKNKRRKFLLYLNEFSQYLLRYSNADYLLPWQPLGSSYWATSEYEILANLSNDKIAPFFSTLALINDTADIKVSKENIYELVMIIAAGFSIEQAADLTIFLIKKEELANISGSVLRIVFELQENNNNTLKLMKIWNKLDEDYTDDDTLKVIYNTFLSIDAKDLFHTLIFSEHISVLLHCCYQIRVIQKIVGLKMIPLLPLICEREDDWMSQYPAVFKSNIARLNSISPDAESIIKKIFLCHWWPESFIDRELYDLKEHSIAAGNEISETRRLQIQSRIVSLEKKLNNHRPITLNVQNKIQDKISQKVSKEQFRLWQDRLEKQFHKNWTSFFQLENEETSSWLFEDEIVRQLLPIIDFSSGSRELAKKVIKRRCSEQPWDLRELPQNKKFLDLLATQGIATKIWMEGIGEQIYQTGSAGAIKISVANDPLEILNMGGHFKTCLTPGNFNYFSVFANIADINKRVIYGKNSKGKVIGRVLTGLLPSGGIKVFNIYYHNAADEFKKYCLEYIELWAEKAGLILTDKGEVPRLVSTRWYDDGAIDVDNGIECFTAGSEFREKLGTIDPADFKHFFEDQLRPLKINELTFPILLQLPELQQANALLPTLIELAQSLPRLNVHDKINLYKLVSDSQQKGFCYTVFRKAILNYLLKTVRDGWFDTELVSEIAAHNPADALKIVKKSGNVAHNWKDSLYHDTAMIAVTALKNLGRDHQANLLAIQYRLPG